MTLGGAVSAVLAADEMPNLAKCRIALGDEKYRSHFIFTDGQAGELLRGCWFVYYNRALTANLYELKRPPYNFRLTRHHLKKWSASAHSSLSILARTRTILIGLDDTGSLSRLVAPHEGVLAEAFVVNQMNHWHERTSTLSKVMKWYDDLVKDLRKALLDDMSGNKTVHNILREFSLKNDPIRDDDVLDKYEEEKWNEVGAARFEGKIREKKRLLAKKFRPRDEEQEGDEKITFPQSP